MKKLLFFGILVFCLCPVFTACRWIKFQETEELQTPSSQVSESRGIYYEGDSSYTPSTKGYSPNSNIPCLEYKYIRNTTFGDPLKTATGLTDIVSKGELEEEEGMHWKLKSYIPYFWFCKKGS